MSRLILNNIDLDSKTGCIHLLNFAVNLCEDNLKIKIYKNRCLNSSEVLNYFFFFLLLILSRI